MFKLCQENATTGNSSSPPRDWFSREKIPVKGLSDQLNVPCCTLRRWAAEYEADGEDAFPGSGNPVANKDYEILQREREEKADDAEAAAIRRKRGCK